MIVEIEIIIGIVLIGIATGILIGARRTKEDMRY